MKAEIKNNKLYYQWRGKRKWRKLYRVGGDVYSTSHSLTEKEARAIADELEKQGYDAWVGLHLTSFSDVLGDKWCVRVKKRRRR